MSEVRLRPKGQVTIPANILERAQLAANATFEVALVNGVITLTPKENAENKVDIMDYAGIFKSVWGDTAEAVNATLDQHRDEWER